MKKRSIIISLLLAIFLPFANAYAADPIISITTLEQLTSFAPAAGNFRLDADIALTGNIAFKEGFNLDLNGHTLNAGANVISISGDVIIKDTSSAQTGKVTGKDKQLFQVNGNRTLTLESGALESTNKYAIYALANSKVIINGGTVKSGSSYGIYNVGALTVNGGLVESRTNVAVVNQGALIINGGKVYSGSNTGVYCQTNASIVLNDGTIQTDGDWYAINLSKAGSSFTMNGGNVLATYDPGPDSDYGGVGVIAFKETTVTINGGTIRAHAQAIMGNGSTSGNNEGTNAKFTITGGTIESNKTAIYAPQPNGETTISGGTITGADVAIEIRAGKLNITGGTFNGGVGNPYESTPNYNGTTAKNAAVVVAQHTTKLPIEVKISGGTFNAEVPFVENNPQGNPAGDIAKISIEITADDYSNMPVFNATGDYTIYSEDFEGFVKAGRYTHNIPDEYVAENYGEIIEADTMDAVYPYHKAEAAEPEHGTVEISREQTLRGIEITINPQPAPGYVVTNIDVVDAEGNHIPVVNNKYLAPNSDTTVTVTFGTPNPATGDDVFDYGAFIGLCSAGLVFAISGIRLARTLRRVL